MEYMTVIVLVVFVVVFSLVGGFLVSKWNKPKQKRTTKSIQSDNSQIIYETYEKTIEVLKNQMELVATESLAVKRRLAKEIGLNKEDDESENSNDISKIATKDLQEHYVIDVNAISKLLPTLNIPMLKNIDMKKIPELLDNPIVKIKAWDYIKKNRKEAIEMGVIVPIGKIEQVEESTEQKKIVNGVEVSESFADESKFSEQHMA